MEKKKTTLGILRTVTWVGAILTCLLYFYVNHFMPRGPIFNTGEEECIEYNDGRSMDCHDRYVEDTRGLNIPDWAKFLKNDTSSWVLGFIVLLIFFEYNIKDDEYSWPNLRNKN